MLTVSNIDATTCIIGTKFDARVVSVLCNNAVLCCHFILSEADEQMSMEHWRNYLQGKSDMLRENLSKCPFVHHKFHIEWPGIEPGLPQRQTSDLVSHGKAHM